MTQNAALHLLATASRLGPKRRRVVLDRPSGDALELTPRQAPIGEERPEYEHTAHWVLCDVRLASGLIVQGTLRLTPPQPGRINPKITRATAIIAHMQGLHIDLIQNGERQRVRLPAYETFPLQVRLSTDPPNPITGLVAGHPDDELPTGEWSRGLRPIDFVLDVAPLSKKI